MRSQPAVVETIKAYCRLFAAEAVDVVAAAQRFGMHILDDKQLSVSFTPRDRGFAHGIAVRKWRTNDLGSIDLDVEPTFKLPFSTLRDAFGPFQFVPRFHPGDDYEFDTAWHPPDSKSSCRLVVTLGAKTRHPTGREPVQRVSIGR